MPKCLICEHLFEPFISFGKMPIANGFLKKEELPKEYYFEMKVGFCSACGMVQLVEQPDREKMFHENYAFFSSTSNYMAEHFKRFSEWVRAEYFKAADPFVLEIGSNDGVMLTHFAKAGIRHLGIEPSKNVAKVAQEKGIRTISEFFDERLASRIKSENGSADAVLSANVMCHIPYLGSVAQGVKNLLKPTGVFIFEDPYLGDVIEKTSYDQIYDEHVFLFSLRSISNLFKKYDLELVDAIPQITHGGSMRYVIAHANARPISARVHELRTREQELGLDKPGTYDKFAKNVARSRDDLMTVLRKLKGEGKRVVGYGATSKSTTITNYCGITPDLVEYICDTTPIKQGKLSPGAHIPIRNHEEFAKNYPEYALLFAWNHEKEIMAKEAQFSSGGGKWISYVPSVRIL